MLSQEYSLLWYVQVNSTCLLSVHSGHPYLTGLTNLYLVEYITCTLGYKVPSLVLYCFAVSFLYTLLTFSHKHVQISYMYNEIQSQTLLLPYISLPCPILVAMIIIIIIFKILSIKCMPMISLIPYTKGSSNFNGKRACNSEYHSIDSIVPSFTIYRLYHEKEGNMGFKSPQKPMV